LWSVEPKALKRRAITTGRFSCQTYNKAVVNSFTYPRIFVFITLNRSALTVAILCVLLDVGIEILNRKNEFSSLKDKTLHFSLNVEHQSCHSTKHNAANYYFPSLWCEVR
jgi:hypothetical protein